jgi:osmotically-inducible protein OsmY
MSNKGSRTLTALGVAMAIISFTGCETSKETDTRSAGRVMDDEHITESVQKSLDQEPAFKFGGVTVKTYDGIVQLSGFVEVQGQRDRAQQLAENTGGVKQVVNAINIKPQPTSRPNETSRFYASPQNPVMPADNATNQNSESK